LRGEATPGVRADGVLEAFPPALEPTLGVQGGSGETKPPGRGFMVARSGRGRVVGVMFEYVYHVLPPALHQEGSLIIHRSNLAYTANELGRHRRGASRGHDA